MKSITQNYVIKAPLDEVWRALVDPEIIAKWSGAPAKMDDHVGTGFKLWGGQIYGTNTKVVKNKLLQQDWFSRKEMKEASKVAFQLTEKAKATEVKLLHSNIPDERVEDISEGWKIYYLGPLKDLLE